MKLLLIALCLALAGCEGDYMFRMADDKMLCSESGQAFYVRRGVGDTSFVKRMPESDTRCKKGRS